MSLMDQVFGYNGSITSSNSTSTSTVWTSYPSHTHTGNISPGIYTTNTGGLSSNITFNPIIDIKRCRNCNHAHLAEQPGCIDQEGWNTIFVVCKCTEYLPKDNLEYLEYLDKKKNK
jgi:phospholipase C